MQRLFLLFAFLILLPFQSEAFQVTFRLNMRGYAGFTRPEVNGTFNNWCGNCNAMTDDNADGIWETTLSLGAGNYEYKFSFDSWTGQENLSDAGSCTITNGTFSNRTLTVNSDVVLDVVCWGLCGDCLSEPPTLWTMNWSEEFEGTQLNSATWSYDLGNSGWGNNELQNYTNAASNLEVSNGSLKITARNDNGNYTSSRIISNNKKEVQSGKIEARIKITIGQGIWPAFWMLGANYENVGWPQCGEIDIMEHVNNESLTNGTMHWYNGTGHSYEGSSVPFVEQDFHVYGIYWDQHKVQFQLDSVPYYEFVYANYPNAESIFTKPFFFLLNVAVGGNWPGNPDGSTVFPATMEVDYIRTYVFDAVGIETSARTVLNAFPNPFSDVIHLNASIPLANWNYTVYSLTGQVLYAGTLATSERHIDTKEWNAGMYVLQLSANGQSPVNLRLQKN
jgi:beta-glucanase (GH16 family)